MAVLAVTNTFAADTDAKSSEVNTNYSDIVTYVNDRNDGSATWDRVSISHATNIPLTANNSTGTQNIAVFQDNGISVLTIANGSTFTFAGAGALTTMLIDNTATDGDPILGFQLSGTSVFTMGVDDGDSDKFKIGTTAIGTNTRFTIVSNGNVGLGTDAPDNKFHVFSGSAGSVSADGSSQLAIEASGNAALNFLTPNTDTGAVIFGDADDNNVGSIVYSHGGTENMAFTVAASLAMTIVATGDVGIGTGSPITDFDLSRSAGNAVVAMNSWSTTNSHRGIASFSKSASATVGTFAETAGGEVLGDIVFVGSDSGNTVSTTAAAITVSQDGSAGANSVAAIMIFSTGTSSGAATERMRIASDGGIVMSALPTSDPSVTGELWNDSGTVKISA